jgi:hypothetical protein
MVALCQKNTRKPPEREWKRRCCLELVFCSTLLVLQNAAPEATAVQEALQPALQPSTTTVERLEHLCYETTIESFRRYYMFRVRVTCFRSEKEIRAYRVHFLLL